MGVKIYNVFQQLKLKHLCTMVTKVSLQFHASHLSENQTSS